MSERALSRLLIAAAVAAAFSPALLNGFVGWDDASFIVENPALRGPLSALTGSFTGGVWIPLTWASLAADHALWGLEPGGYHLTSLLLHLAAALLFHECSRLLFLRLGLKEPERAAVLAALLFALHPLRVESVAWAAERKGVLAGALWTAALLLRLRSHDSPRRAAWEAAAAGAFALSLLAKPNGLTFPLVLFVIETVLLRRRPTARSYAPLLALSAAAFGATLYAGARPGTRGAAAPPGLAWALGQSLHGLFFYPLQTLWPSALSAYYPPLPWFGSWSWPLAGRAAAAAALVAGLRALGAKGRLAAGALACYALALLPMLGLVSHGIPHAAADRFSYLPGMALAALLGAALARAGRAGLTLGAAAAVALGAASAGRCAAWESPLALWSDARRARPGPYADGNYAAELVRLGRHAEAVPLLRQALSRDASEPVFHEALGAALSALGREEQARDAWRAGLSAAPSPELRALLGASLGSAEHLEKAVAAKPSRAGWRVDLGDAYAREGRDADAAAAYESALGLDPREGRALVNLGLLEQRRGRAARARELFVRALASPAAGARALHNLGNLDAGAGERAAAERRFREAVRRDPAFGAARVNLGNLLARRGALAEAASQYRAVKKEDRASFEARSNLAAVEAALGRGR